jgi:hypothetical protein
MSFRYHSQEELSEHLSSLLEEDAEKVRRLVLLAVMHIAAVTGSFLNQEFVCNF